MSDESGKANRQRHTRSPSYPAISLERALERADSLYSVEKQYPTPVEIVVHHWGYSVMSGIASQHLAALKKFGLLEEEGSNSDRRVRISDLAVKIMKHPVDGVRAEAIREAALLPTAHQELWAMYGPDLPPDRTLMWELTRNKGFSESGARELIKEYRETAAFADLFSTGRPGPVVDPSVEVNELQEELLEPPVAPATVPRSVRIVTEPASWSFTPERRTSGVTVVEPKRPRMPNYQIPLPGGSQVSFEGPFPLTEVQWDFMLRILDAMKPGLTEANGSAFVEAD